MTTMTDSSVREFKMPDVGEGLTEAEILKWYVQPGDTVTDGQVVCEVETAKGRRRTAHPLRRRGPRPPLPRRHHRRRGHLDHRGGRR
ncbi:hypothetical protein RKD37_004658 [Streptomyces ambofaciens]